LVAVILISRYQRPLQKIKMGCTSLLQPIRSHKTAHTDCVFVVARGASVGSFLSLLYVSLTTHADPYEATLSLSLVLSLSPIGCGEVASHNSRIVVVGRRARATPRQARVTPRRETVFFFLLLDGLHLVHLGAPQQPEAVQEQRGAHRRPNGGGVQRGADEHVVHVVHGHARVSGTGDHPRRGPRQRR
jgi:hypothetical protein